MDTWTYFVLGIIVANIFKAVYKIARQELGRRREKNLLKVVKIEFPDSGTITFSSIETSDKKAMADLKRQILGHTELEKEAEDEFAMIDFPVKPPQ